MQSRRAQRRQSTKNIHGERAIVPGHDLLIWILHHGSEGKTHWMRQIKERFPDFLIVGSAYTYLQEFLPHVAQHVVRTGGVDLVGLGRMVLAYHDLPADVLERGEMRTKQLCRTFSDCTTAPRNGMI